MAIPWLIYSLFALLIVAHLITPFLTTLFARLIGRDGRHAQSKSVDFGCIITAYRNAEIARPLVASLLKQTHGLYHVYLVADECPPDFTLGLDDHRVSVILPEAPLRLKAKSIIEAMRQSVRKHDFIVIFDADNLAHPNFLEEISHYVGAGFLCVQGRRTAKNTDNSFAAADSLGEIYKNHIERYAPFLLGGSSVISGSGMATETALYQAYLDGPEIQAGRHLGKKMLQEDKILQNFLVQRGIRIAYAIHAVCYDEKVQSGEAVETQRSRWLYSYFQNLPNAFGLLVQGMKRLNWNQLYFGWITSAPPMFIQVGLALILLVINLIFWPEDGGFSRFIWHVAPLIALLIFAGNVFWTLSLSGAPDAVWRAVGAMPAFVWRQFRGLFKMRNPNKHFKHTEHTQYVSVDEVLKKEE